MSLLWHMFLPSLPIYITYSTYDIFSSNIYYDYQLFNLAYLVYQTCVTHLPVCQHKCYVFSEGQESEHPALSFIIINCGVER
jgi:hypothetical protein